jgi:hypothetical protein
MQVDDQIKAMGAISRTLNKLNPDDRAVVKDWFKKNYLDAPAPSTEPAKS